MLEGRCLPSGNPAVTTYIPEDNSGDHLSAAIAPGGSLTHTEHEDSVWSASRSASHASSDDADQSDHSDPHSQSDGGDHSDDGTSSYRSTSASDDSGDGQTESSGGDGHTTTTPPPVVNTGNPPPVSHTGPPPTTSHSVAPPVQQKSEDKSIGSDTASSVNASTELSSFPDAQSEPSAALASPGASPPSLGRTQTSSGAASLPVDSGAAQSSHVAAADGHVGGQNGSAISPAPDMYVRDNHHGNDGQTASVLMWSSQAGRAAERPAVIMPSSEVVWGASDAEALPPAYAEAALPVQGMLLTNILPIDFSALESSIRSFFDRVQSFGSDLAESRIDLLFSTCVLVATTAVALEVVRRQMKPATPAFEFGREGIPYSDFA
jgi:hypothetical protein